MPLWSKVFTFLHFHGKKNQHFSLVCSIHKMPFNKRNGENEGTSINYFSALRMQFRKEESNKIGLSTYVCWLKNARSFDHVELKMVWWYDAIHSSWNAFTESLYIVVGGYNASVQSGKYRTWHKPRLILSIWSINVSRDTRHDLCCCYACWKCENAMAFPFLISNIKILIWWDDDVKCRSYLATEHIACGW